jgi:hypothetical protein
LIFLLKGGAFSEPDACPACTTIPPRCFLAHALLLLPEVVSALGRWPDSALRISWPPTSDGSLRRDPTPRRSRGGSSGSASWVSSWCGRIARTIQV